MVTALVTRGRARAEALMLDRVQVARLTGTRGPVDPDTLLQTHEAVLIYQGKARIRPETGVDGIQVNAGEGHAVLSVAMVALPMDAPVQPDDLLQVVESVDSILVGSWLRVLPIDAGTHITARRLHCRITELTPPVVEFVGGSPDEDPDDEIGGGGP